MGWSAYILVYIFFYFTIRTKPSPIFFQLVLLDAAGGILITHLMRILILRTAILKFEIRKQIIYLCLTTILFSFMYAFLIVGITQTVGWEAEQMNEYSFMNKVMRYSFNYFYVSYYLEFYILHLSLCGEKPQRTVRPHKA